MNSIGKTFMQMTQYKNMAGTAQTKGAAQPPLELPTEPGEAPIALPNPKVLEFGNAPLIDIINQRRSLRGYSEEPLTPEELSFLLWCCQGVQEQTDKYTLRTVPSAGARHALETYLLANRVDGLAPGVYRYLALSHALVAVDLSADITDKLTASCLKQGMVRDCAAAFFWAAAVERMAFRYGERGYRYLHLDAGHACQNLSLAAESIGGGACAIGAYDDDALNGVLGLDGEKMFVVYAAMVGKKPG